MPLPLFCLSGSQISGENLSDLALFVVADDQIDRVIFFHAFGIGLHVAADRDDDGIGVLFFRAVQHLPALPVRDIGHGAGVDDIDVRLVLKRDFFVSLISQDLPHNIQFIAVYLTAQIVKCYLFH